MQSIEDFMYELFKAHVEVERAKLTAYEAFRERFFVADYQPFNTHEFCHSCEAERIEAVEHSANPDGFTVVTTSTVYWSLRLQYRYYLQRRADTWLCMKVTSFCKVCDGSG